MNVSLIAGNLIYVSSATDITSAMNSALPGDTLVMTNGIWTDQRIVFSGNGTEEANIVLRAETPGQVVLNGISTLRIAGNYLTVSGLYFLNGRSISGAVIEFRNGSSQLANNCRLTETAIENYNPTSGSTDYKWISLYGTYNRVDHCFMRGKTHSGTTLVVWLDGQPNYHLIDSNYFAYRPELGVNGGETIRVGTSDYSMTDSYTTVENNYFEKCNGEIEIISSKSGNNIYRYNTFYECEGALTLRHGNYAEVYGNYFIGNNKSNTGGVRIIGEDHKVYNNYFENLRGTSFRAALTMVNGVLNSPLNRYFQVKRAEVVNNTFVNCSETFNIGAGKDSERTLPPLDCKISNNIATSSSRLIEYEDDPINMLYENNIIYGGPIGITQPDGITIVDPQLITGTDNLWRISSNSPAIDSASTNYNYIFDDMDGQFRGSSPDIGSDEYSMDAVTRRPLNDSVTGPSWHPAPLPPIELIKVFAGVDSLKNALTLANDGEIIELVSDGGIYSNNSDLIIDKTIIIRAASGLSSKPIIQNISQSSSTRSVFVIRDGGNLELRGLALDGMSGTVTPAKYLIRTDDNGMSESYKLKVDSCNFYDVNIGTDGNFFRAYEDTFADSIIISNSLFNNCGKEGIRLKDETSQSGNYNVEVFELSNCTFWNIPREAIYIYAGDNVLFTPGPKININHCTFDNCAYENTLAIRVEECDDTFISNSIITNSSVASASVALFGNNASISYTNIFESGTVEINRGASIRNGMIEVDPLYEDRAAGNFTLPSNSSVLNKANDGSSLGDLRWAVNPPSFVTLTLAVFGSGSITTDPSHPLNDYTIGSTVTLNAVPAAGYEFVQWSGDASGSNSVIQITMDAAKEIVAVFQLLVSVANDEGIVPDDFNLYQNFPNPFNPSTVIKFGLPEQAFVKIDVFNTNGELVHNLLKREYNKGYYSLNWDANNLPSGNYFVRMIVGDKGFVRKAVLVK